MNAAMCYSRETIGQRDVLVPNEEKNSKNRSTRNTATTGTVDWSGVKFFAADALGSDSAAVKNKTGLQQG